MASRYFPEILILLFLLCLLIAFITVYSQLIDLSWLPWQNSHSVKFYAPSHVLITLALYVAFFSRKEEV